MTLTDKDAQRRPWCMFADVSNYGLVLGRLIHVRDDHNYPFVCHFLHAYTHCRECTPEELAELGLTQPPQIDNELKQAGITE